MLKISDPSLSQKYTDELCKEMDDLFNIKIKEKMNENKRSKFEFFQIGAFAIIPIAIMIYQYIFTPLNSVPELVFFLSCFYILISCISFKRSEIFSRNTFKSIFAFVCSAIFAFILILIIVIISLGILKYLSYLGYKVDIGKEVLFYVPCFVISLMWIFHLINFLTQKVCLPNN